MVVQFRAQWSYLVPVFELLCQDVFGEEEGGNQRGHGGGRDDESQRQISDLNGIVFLVTVIWTRRSTHPLQRGENKTTV